MKHAALVNNYGYNGERLSQPKLNLALRLFYDTENIADSQITFNDDEIVVDKHESSDLSGNVSFGIAWSGQENHRNDLIACVDSILSANHAKREIDIMVACPGDNFFDLNESVRWIHVPNSSEGIDIGAKKNMLYEKAKYEIVSIIHTRIRFKDDFFSNLPSNFDCFSPAIYANYNGKILPYFDLVLIRNSDYFLNRGSKVRNHLNRFFYEKKSHIAKISEYQYYIDGGCIVLNKQKFGIKGPWHKSLKWGEAEDVWLSRYIDLFGFVQDRIETIIAYSSTNKSRSLTGNLLISRLKLMFYRLVWFW